MFSTATTILLALLGTTSAHMEVQFPPPLKSKFNPNTPSGQADYTMVAPLQADGSDFPCKGYQSLLGTAAGAPTASFAIGSKGNMTITGGANHGGGSCQISLSTDGAKTFTVIQSIVGGCPTSGTSNLDFTIPSDVPAGDAVMAWTWHNQIGNREMYMNCAAVTLTGGGARRKNRRATAYAARPGIYIANVGAAGGGCTTKESFDVVYPMPGPDVVDQSQKPQEPGCGITQKVSAGSGSGSGSGTGSGTGSGSGSGSAPPSPGGGGGGIFAPGGGSAPSSAPSAPVAATPVSPATFATVMTKPTATAAPSAPPSAGSASGSGSESGSGSGSGSGAGAAAPAPSSAGSSSSGTASTPNAPGSACTEEGAWACLAGGTSFQRCASGLWSAVLPTAAGTSCTGGVSAQLNMVAIQR